MSPSTSTRYHIIPDACVSIDADDDENTHLIDDSLAPYPIHESNANGTELLIVYPTIITRLLAFIFLSRRSWLGARKVLRDQNRGYEPLVYSNVGLVLGLIVAVTFGLVYSLNGAILGYFGISFLMLLVVDTRSPGTVTIMLRKSMGAAWEMSRDGRPQSSGPAQADLERVIGKTGEEADKSGIRA